MSARVHIHACRCGKTLQIPAFLRGESLRCPVCRRGVRLGTADDGVPMVARALEGSEDREAIDALLEPSRGRGLAVGAVSLIWLAAAVLSLWVSVELVRRWSAGEEILGGGIPSVSTAEWIEAALQGGRR